MITSRWRGPGWRLVDADGGNARLVRDWISSAITLHCCAVDPADAALAVGELFTNAVGHGPGGRVLVGYCLWPDGARIVVADGGSSGMPTAQPAASTDENGRGLQVVEAITAQWGCLCFRDAGHLVVWCDLGQPLSVEGNDPWAWLHRLFCSGIQLSAPVPEQIPRPGLAFPARPAVPPPSRIRTPVSASLCAAGASSLEHR